MNFFRNFFNLMPWSIDRASEEEQTHELVKKLRGKLDRRKHWSLGDLHYECDLFLRHGVRRSFMIPWSPGTQEELLANIIRKGEIAMEFGELPKRAKKWLLELAAHIQIG